jgi:hypothetical protein
MVDLIVGAGLVAVERLSAGLADEAYLRAVLLTLMRGLGLPSDRAEKLIAEPLAPLDLSPDSLVMRSQARFQKQKRGKRR